MNHIQTVEAYYDGHAFVPITPVAAQMNERAIITILDGITDKSMKQKSGKAYLNYAGTLSDENYDNIMEILKDTRQVDANEW